MRTDDAKEIPFPSFYIDRKYTKNVVNDTSFFTLLAIDFYSPSLTF